MIAIGNYIIIEDIAENIKKTAGGLELTENTKRCGTVKVSWYLRGQKPLKKNKKYYTTKYQATI